ncbi:MAG: hypothetical protein ABI321_03180, partial [Polyangia bacterium]
MNETAAASEVQSALRRVSARLRLAQLVVHGTRAGSVFLAGLAAAVTAHGFGALGRGATLAACAALTIAVALYLLARVRPVSAATAAHAADHALGLSDRLSSAYAFALEPTPTALMLAAVVDGGRVAPGVDAAKVVHLAVPRSAWTVPLAAGMLVAAFFVHPARHVERPRAKEDRPRFVVEPDALMAERRAVQKLGIESRGKDAELEQLAHQLDELLAAVDQQKLTRAEVFEQLSKLEAQHGKPSEKPLDPSAALKPATDVLARSKQTEKLA